MTDEQQAAETLRRAGWFEGVDAWVCMQPFSYRDHGGNVTFVDQGIRRPLADALLLESKRPK